MTIPGDLTQVGDRARLAARPGRDDLDGSPGARPRQTAHDVAHLVNVVGNLAHLLLMQSDDPVAVRRHAARLAQLAERSADLVDRVAGRDPDRGRGSARTGGGGVPRARLAPAARTPLHVLVVEDEAAGRDLLGALLSGAGHRVTTVAGVRDALRALHSPDSPRVDVMLTDVGLGDGSGWELVGHARRELPAVRVGVVTGRPGVCHDVRSGDAHFVVGKPFRVDELLVQVGGADR